MDDRISNVYKEESDNIMYCKFCGKELKDDVKFCTKCGKKLEMGTSTENSNPIDEKQNKGVFVVIALIIVILAVGILLFIRHKADTDKTSELVIEEISSSETGDVSSSEGLEESSTQGSTEEVELLPTDSDFASAKVGDIVTFGQYDYNVSEGVEPIEWEVRAVEGDKLLLVSKYLTEFNFFDDFIKSATYSFEATHEYNWESSDLREYLNTVVLNQMFNAAELKYIINSEIVTESGANYYLNYMPEEIGTARAKYLGLYEDTPLLITNDRLFLLSFEDLVEYYDMEIDKKGMPTFLKAADISGKGKVFDFYLRNHGGVFAQMFCLSPETGHISERGLRNGIRPAMWVSLEGTNDISDIDLCYTERDFTRSKIEEAGYTSGNIGSDEIDISMLFKYDRIEMNIDNIICMYACDDTYFSIHNMEEDCGMSFVTKEHAEDMINSFADMFDADITPYYNAIEDVYLELCGIYAETGKPMERSDYIDITDRMPGTITINVEGQEEPLSVKKVLAGTISSTVAENDSRPVYDDGRDIREASEIELLFITESNNRKKIAEHFSDIIYGDKYVASRFESEHCGRKVILPSAEKADFPNVEENMTEEKRPENVSGSSSSIVGVFWDPTGYNDAEFTFNADGTGQNFTPSSGKVSYTFTYTVDGNKITVKGKHSTDSFTLDGDTLIGVDGKYKRK